MLLKWAHSHTTLVQSYSRYLEPETVPYMELVAEYLVVVEQNNKPELHYQNTYRLHGWSISKILHNLTYCALRVPTPLARSVQTAVPGSLPYAVPTI